MKIGIVYDKSVEFLKKTIQKLKVNRNEKKYNAKAMEEF